MIYRVILRKVSFGIFRIILVSKEEKYFSKESQHKVLSMSLHDFHDVLVKIIKIIHLKDHISKKIMVQKSFLCKIEH